MQQLNNKLLKNSIINYINTLMINNKLVDIIKDILFKFHLRQYSVILKDNLVTTVKWNQLMPI